MFLQTNYEFRIERKNIKLISVVKLKISKYSVVFFVYICCKTEMLLSYAVARLLADVKRFMSNMIITKKCCGQDNH